MTSVFLCENVDISAFVKSHLVITPLMDALLKDLRQEYFDLKRQLAQQKIRVIEWNHGDEYFSDVQIATAGNDVVLRYANQALKTQVEKLLINHINEKRK
ncbi:aconitate hydratase [Lysinibacillus capsici]|uniref:aconitate hydratase n=1 Tax=Lysinibacillus capsici TaxID=2115968 RepID=UPI0028EEF4F6|nr:aconitate hydratase [uncultured Lysinibacillus sp.]